MPAIKRPSYTTPANRRAKWRKADAQKHGWEDDRQDNDKPREEQTINSGNEGTRRADKRKDKRNIHGQEDDGPNQVEEERNKSGDLINNKTGDTFWPAERILRETKTRYLIAWSPSSETGQKFRPTWEPKENANEGLRSEWEGNKVQKKSRSANGRDTEKKTQETKNAARDYSHSTIRDEDQSAEAAERAEIVADPSEEAEEAENAGFSKAVNDTGNITDPNPSPSLAASLKFDPKAITYGGKQRRLPQRRLFDFHGRESVESA